MPPKKSLQTTKPVDKSRRAKPLVVKGGLTKSRTPYRCGGKASK